MSKTNHQDPAKVEAEINKIKIAFKWNVRYLHNHDSKEHSGASKRCLVYMFAYLATLGAGQRIRTPKGPNILADRQTAGGEMIRLAEYWTKRFPDHPLPQDLKNLKQSDYS